MVLLSDPDEVRSLFTASTESLHPGEGGRIAQAVVGEKSVMQLDEGEHLAHRRMILPSFHGERVERLAKMMVEITEREVSGWPLEQPVVLYPRLQTLTLEVILRTVFGLDPGRRLDLLRSGLIEALDANAKLLSLLPFTRRSPAGLGPWARFEAARARNDSLLFELIDERRRENSNRDDVLSTLLDARRDDGLPMSDKEVRDELMTLLAGGHESVASALAWTFEQLARAL